MAKWFGAHYNQAGTDPEQFFGRGASPLLFPTPCPSKIFHIWRKKEGKKEDRQEAGERSEPLKFGVFGRKTVPK